MVSERMVTGRTTWVAQAAIWLIAASLSLGAQPRRIVSTSPSITETLFGLGAGSQVVGVSTYCRYPADVLKLPKIGSYSKPNAESIAALRPDLVILHRQSGDLANRLEAMRIPTLTIEQGSLAQLYASVRAIGQAVARPTQAAELVARIESKVRVGAASRETSSGKRPGPSVLIVVSKDRERLTSLIAAGPGTYLGELVEAMGGRNALTGGQTNLYPRISLETVIHLNPDFIIDASGMGDSPNDTSEQRQKTIAPWLARSDLAAARNQRVSAVLSEALVVPGPRVLDALEIIRKTLAGWEDRR